MPARASGWSQRLAAAWWSARPPGLALRALGWSFGRLALWRRAAYRHGWLKATRPDVPVVVVGNRIVGGAGKTPITLALLEHLQDHGWQPGVVSRGHGGAGHGCRAVTPTSPAADVGDEPALIARRAGVPVWVGRERAAAAAALRAAHPEVDVIVCDDGLQHLALARDVELVVFDARGAGNGRCLPAGPLREPLDAPAAAPAHWVVYNAAQRSTPLPGVLTLRALAAPVPLRRWQHAAACLEDDPDDAEAWRPWIERGEAVWAVAGIGAPERFFGDLRAHGLRPRTLALDDHARYDTLPWPADARHVLVTEKDAIKLDADRIARERPGCEVAVVPMRITLPPALLEPLLAALAARRAR